VLLSISKTSVLTTKLLPLLVVKKATDAIARLGPGAGHLSLFLGLDASSDAMGLPEVCSRTCAVPRAQHSCSRVAVPSVSCASRLPCGRVCGDCGGCASPAGAQSNYWVQDTLDHDTAHREFYRQTRVSDADFPAYFLSFPSKKDPTWERRHPNKSVVLVVTECKYEWLEQWKGLQSKKRGREYDAIKSGIEKRLLDVFYGLFPQCRGHVVYTDLGTPLSNDFYIGAHRGSSYGISHKALRFHLTEPGQLSAHTDIKGLYLTGQDIVSAGVAGALAGGAMTAFAISPQSLWNDIGLLL
jgi:hypothetical protein